MFASFAYYPCHITAGRKKSKQQTSLPIPPKFENSTTFVENFIFFLHLDIAATQSARNPGVWEFELYNSTLDRSALADAITAAETLLAATVSDADGTTISNTLYWATPGDIAAYKTAITAATAVRNNPAIIAEDAQTIADAVDTLGIATDTFNLARAEGFANDNTALVRAIAAANKLLGLFPEAFVSTTSADFYPNQRIVAQGDKTTYSNAITAAQTATTGTQDEINQAKETLDAATETFKTKLIAGTKANRVDKNIAPQYQKVTASNVNDSNRAGDKAVDDSCAGESRWATGGGLTYPVTLELDFGSPVTITKWEMVAYANVVGTGNGRLQEFYIEYLGSDGETWTPVYSRAGTPINGAPEKIDNVPTSGEVRNSYKIGEDLSEDATAQTFRLRIKTASAGPSIYEFRLFTP